MRGSLSCYCLLSEISGLSFKHQKMVKSVFVVLQVESFLQNNQDLIYYYYFQALACAKKVFKTMICKSSIFQEKKNIKETSSFAISRYSFVQI